jgi:stearoyl-CoA desaturase (delta-9 desaturase)
MQLGLLDLPWWGLVLTTAVACHITVIGVTLFLHRDQTHRGLDLHPAVRMFFRTWLWMTTGIVTKEWVAIHRKHHAKCETAEDPHSPVMVGLRKVVLEGSELYRAEAKQQDTLDKYGRGTPDDWMERHVFTGRSYWGVLIMLGLDVLLFGPIGLTIYAIQMMTIPVLAAGVINGVGHYYGYRSFECKDAATNVMPWGVVMGGEELHNNHHAFPSSARFQIRPFEFDIGWQYIRVLRALGLAEVRREAPQLQFDADRRQLDAETVRAVIVNRMHVLRDYTLNVTLPTWRAEMHALRDRVLSKRAYAVALMRDKLLLDDAGQQRLRQVLERSERLKTVYEFRERLALLWEQSAASNDRLVQQLKDWCAEAEATGIESLQEFALRIRGYTTAPHHA